MFRLTSNVRLWSEDAKEVCKTDPFTATEFVNRGTFSATDIQTLRALTKAHKMREYIATWHNEEQDSYQFYAPSHELALWFAQTVMLCPPDSLVQVTYSEVEYTTENARLEYLRGELELGRISYLELSELQGLADHIEPGDVRLLEAAGVPEFGESEGGDTT